MKFTEDKIIEESPRSVPPFIVLMNKNQSLYENLKNRWTIQDEIYKWELHCTG